MAEIRATGTTEPVRQADELTYDPQRGYSRTIRYECVGENLFGTANQLAALGYNYNLTSSGAKSVLIATSGAATDGQPEVTTDTWQILANEIQKDIREHPLFRAVSEADLQRIQSCLSTGITPQPAFVDANANTLFTHLVRGTTHYALSQYVLKHTTNVSNGYSANVADSNIERIYSSAQLIAEAQNGTLWAYPMPGRLAYKINSIAAPTIRPGYMWGWRKLASTETTTAGNRIEISTEYWLEQWSLSLYSQAA